MKALRVLAAAAVLAVGVVLAGDVTVSEVRRLARGQAFVDRQGRTRVFHGVNAVYKQAPWLPKREGWDTNTTLGEEDARLLREWGFNVVRLGVMWPGVAPTRGSTDEQYLADVRATVDVLGKHGIYVVLDMHQDLAGRALCGEGFPDWAVNTSRAKRAFPAPVRDKEMKRDTHGYPLLEECLEIPFAHYYLTDAVGAAFQAFYANTHGARDEFVRFWTVVARAFADAPNVLGYELINEPWAGDVAARPRLWLPTAADRENLMPLYNLAHDAIRRVDDRTVLFFEKSLVNPVGPTGFRTVPGGRPYRGRTALSWHNYCGSVDRSGNPTSWTLCWLQQVVQLWQSERDLGDLACGSFLSEFGAVSGGHDAALKSLDWLLGKADAGLHSWAYWQYKSYADITTMADDKEGFYWANGTLQEDKVAALSRAYAHAIAGTDAKQSFDRARGRYTLTYRLLHTPDGSGTVIYVGALTRRTKNNSTEQLIVTVTPETAANATFSDDGLFLHVVPTSGADAPREGDQIRVEVVLPSAAHTATVAASLLLFLLTHRAAQHLH